MLQSVNYYDAFFMADGHSAVPCASIGDARGPQLVTPLDFPATPLMYLEWICYVSIMEM